MKVEVLDIYDLGMGNLRAYASIQIGPLQINKVRLIKQPGQKPYVSPPQLEYLSGNTVKYIPIVKWPDEWKTPIFEAVWAAYNAQRETPPS